MKRALTTAGILVLVLTAALVSAPPTQAQDEFFAKQGYYQGKDFPPEAAVKHTYDEAWTDGRSKAQLRSLFRVLGKEKTGEDQFRLHFLYQRPDGQSLIRDDVLVKKLDTNLWLMVDAAAGGTAAQAGVTRVIKRPPAN